jgi:sugar lactone lactonase YvrE
MRRTEARVFFEPEREEDRYLPEGPRHLLAEGQRWGPLGWVNIQAGPTSKHGTVFTRAWGNATSLFNRQDLSGRVGFLLPALNSPWVIVGCEKALKVQSTAYEKSRTLASIPDDNPRTIINDGEIVPGGKAIVFGTKDVQFKDPVANLYLYTVDDNRVSLLADGQTCSNGKVFATDSRGLILYDIDTPKRNVVRYRLDVEARTTTPDGVALDLAGEPGFPDGMCDCGDGTVIVAFYNPDFVEAGRAVRFDLASGRAVEEWTTPGSPRVTCPLLVKRPEGVKLILTTATEGMPAELRARCPNAGCLFIADTQFESCPEPEVVRLTS